MVLYLVESYLNMHSVTAVSKLEHVLSSNRGMFYENFMIQRGITMIIPIDTNKELLFVVVKTFREFSWAFKDNAQILKGWCIYLQLP